MRPILRLMLICTENKDILLESNKIFDYSKARTNTLVQTRDKGVCILLGNSKQKNQDCFVL